MRSTTYSGRRSGFSVLYDCTGDGANRCGLARRDFIPGRTAMAFVGVVGADGDVGFTNLGILDGEDIVARGECCSRCRGEGGEAVSFVRDLEWLM